MLFLTRHSQQLRSSLMSQKWPYTQVSRTNNSLHLAGDQGLHYSFDSNATRIPTLSYRCLLTLGGRGGCPAGNTARFPVQPSPCLEYRGAFTMGSTCVCVWAEVDRKGKYYSSLSFMGVVFFVFFWPLPAHPSPHPPPEQGVLLPLPVLLLIPPRQRSDSIKSHLNCYLLELVEKREHYR